MGCLFCSAGTASPPRPWPSVYSRGAWAINRRQREVLLAEAAEYDWLGLGDITRIQTPDNPFFAGKSQEDIEQPHLHLLKIIRNPAYFGFTCKHILGIDLAPFQLAILWQLWFKSRPMLLASRGAGKSFLLGLYALLRALIDQGSKVVMIGKAFRQSKAVFEYSERIWNNAPVLRDLVGPEGKVSKETDKWVLRLGESTISALPLGDGESIRGQRACVGGNTLVMTSQGLLRMEEIQELPHLPLSWVANGGGRGEPPTRLVVTDPIPAWEIICEGNLSFSCSGIHRVLGKDAQWKDGISLGEGDELALGKAEWPPGENSFEPLAYCLGVLSTRKTRWSRPSIKADIGSSGGECLEKLAYQVKAIEPEAMCRLSEKSLCVLSQKFFDKVSRGARASRGIPKEVRATEWALLEYLRGLFSVASLSRDFRGALRICLGGLKDSLAREVQSALILYGVLARRKTRGKFSCLTLAGKDAKGLALLLGWEKKRGWKKRESLKVLSVRKLPGLHTLYDFTMPLSHSFWGNGFIQHNTHLLVDEFPTINPEVFEVVIKGFSSVSASPVDRMRQISRFNKLKEYGLLSEEAKLSIGYNQTVISGTANYTFNHFYRYWRRYKAIIESRGEARLLEQAFEGGEMPEYLDWKDYVVVRIPYELIPFGYMDEKSVADSRATMHTSSYILEYGASFASDSNGFYKRSVVERCVAGKQENPIVHPSCGLAEFGAVLKGSPGKKYAMGVDPAIEQDNFAVVILELWPDHRRIVHCWTTKKKAFLEAKKEGLTKEQDFYRYAVRKIRLLHKLFPCELIAIDGQGGGAGILQALQDTSYLSPDDLLFGDRALLPIIEEDIEKPTDDLPGEHILHVIQFSRSEWVSGANNGLRADLENKLLLFPEFSSADLGMALEEDRLAGRVKRDDDGRTLRIHDTLEDCMVEIEDLKDELASIVHTQTGIAGRDKWDTPEVKLPGGRKGRQRKDRYSALLMANAQARTMAMMPILPVYEGFGRVARGIPQKGESNNSNSPAYLGDSWFAQKANALGNYGVVIKKKQ